MLSANEALMITRGVRKSDVELKEIESRIKNKAMIGEYSVTLYPSMPYQMKTIIELRRFGYKVSSYIDEYQHHRGYCIEWGDENENEGEEEWRGLEW